MRLIITHHAVEQFIERHARDLTFKQARQFLIQNAPGAAPLKQKTLRGDQQWQMENPKCVLVMKQDRKIKAHVCVTVLPEAEGLDEISDEELYRIMEEGEPDFSQIDSLIEAAEAEKVHLITPSVSLEAEEQRIEKEHKLWQQVLLLRKQMFGEHTLRARRKATHQQLRISDMSRKNAELRAVLKHLIRGLEGSSMERLLAEAQAAHPQVFIEESLKIEKDVVETQV